MRVPVELDRDADVVLAELVRRLNEAEDVLEELSPEDHNQWLAIHEAFKQGADQYCKDAIRYRKIKKLGAHELSEIAMLASTDVKFDEMVDSL